MADTVYELRFYNFNLSGAAMYRTKLDENIMKVRRTMGPVLGPWEVHLNGIAQFFHVAVHDNLDHLLSGRRQLGTNEALIKWLEPFADKHWTFTNALCVLAPGTKLDTDFTPSDTAMYELQTLPEGSELTKLASNATLVGRFVSVFGPNKTEYRLIRYPDAASAMAAGVARKSDLPSGWETRLMEPLPVSAQK